jgi:hypothetical protein
LSGLQENLPDARRAAGGSLALENNGDVFVREKTGRSGHGGRQEGALSKVQP